MEAPRHIHDIAALCCPDKRSAPINRLTADLLDEIKEDRLVPLLVSDLVEGGMLTEEQVQSTGVAFQSKFQACGYREGETPLTPHDMFLRGKSNFVTKGEVESFARREGFPINTLGWR